MEGIPIVSNLKKINVGADVPKMFSSDHVAEDDAIRSYNAAISLCGDEKDFATREILEGILEDEDRHIDRIEEVQDEINQMGIQLFLSTQLS